MISEIPHTQISNFASGQLGPHLALVLDSIAAGNTAAQLWHAQQAGEPAVSLLWDKGNNVFYIAGERLDSGTQQEISQLIGW